MDIQFACPTCSHAITILDTQVGQPVVCEQCGAEIDTRPDKPYALGLQASSPLPAGGDKTAHGTAKQAKPFVAKPVSAEIEIAWGTVWGWLLGTIGTLALMVAAGSRIDEGGIINSGLVADRELMALSGLGLVITGIGTRIIAELVRLRTLLAARR